MSLREQLAKVYAKERGTNVDLLVRDKTKYASILYDLKIAADLNEDEIFEIAVAGFRDLCAQDDFFFQFEADFFSSASRQVSRSNMVIQLAYFRQLMKMIYFLQSLKLFLRFCLVTF